MTATKMTRSAHGLDSGGDDWRDGALCSLATARQFDVNATRTGNPQLTAGNRQALALCRHCPVNKHACLDNALSNHPHLWTIAAGRLVFNGQVVDVAPPRQPRPRRTPRDPDLPARITALHHEGRSNQAIANLLSIAVVTVRKYVRLARQP